MIGRDRTAGRAPFARDRPRIRKAPTGPEKVPHERVPAARIGMPAAAAEMRVAPVPPVLPARAPRPGPDPEIVPVAFEAEPRPDREPDAKGDKRARVPIGGIAVDDVRVVLRRVDHVLLRGYDPDVVALDVDLLLGRVDERARSLGLRPQLLD